MKGGALEALVPFLSPDHFSPVQPNPTAYSAPGLLLQHQGSKAWPPTPTLSQVFSPGSTGRPGTAAPFREALGAGRLQKCYRPNPEPPEGLSAPFRSRGSRKKARCARAAAAEGKQACGVSPEGDTSPSLAPERKVLQQKKKPICV